MEEFLNTSKLALVNLSSFGNVRVVLGNPTCDLDSAVCALVQGYLEYLEVKEKDQSNVAVIPVMNIFEKEFRVKTEVVYFLRHHGIPSNLLTFRDQIDLIGLAGESRKRLELILVDHHGLADEDRSLADSVVEIIDHRPQDASWPWHGRTIHLQAVGSCATLVARNILLRRKDVLKDVQICHLLRGPILVDTCNLSKEADRATPLDIEIIEQLESVGLVGSNRCDVYKEILAAKTDIRGLTADDLMIRDLKFANSIPIVGFPMLVENFLKLEGAYRAVEAFTRSKNVTLTILIGMDLKNDRVTREIGIFSLSCNDLENKIIQALTSSSEPALELTLVKRIQEEDRRLTLYRQGNLRATRKQILPIVQTVTKNFTGSTKLS